MALKAEILVPRLDFERLGWGFGLETVILTSRLGFELRGWDLDLLGRDSSQGVTQELEEKHKTPIVCRISKNQ